MLGHLRLFSRECVLKVLQALQENPGMMDRTALMVLLASLAEAVSGRSNDF